MLISENFLLILKNLRFLDDSVDLIILIVSRALVDQFVDFD